MSAGYDAERRAATAAQTATTGKRWCNSCHVFRSADSGRERTVRHTSGGTAVQWRCGVCEAWRMKQGRR